MGEEQRKAVDNKFNRERGGEIQRKKTVKTDGETINKDVINLPVKRSGQQGECRARVEILLHSLSFNSSVATLCFVPNLRVCRVNNTCKK